VEAVFPLRDCGDGPDGVDRRDLHRAVVGLQKDRLGGEAEGLGGDLGGLGGGGGSGGGGPLFLQQGGEGGKIGGGNGLGFHAVAFRIGQPGTPRRGPVATATDRDTLRDCRSVVKPELKRKGPGFPPGLLHSSDRTASTASSRASSRATAIMRR